MAKINENMVLRSGKVLRRRATVRKARTTPASKISKMTRQPVQRTLRQRVEPASVISNLSHFDLRYAPAYSNGRGGKQVTAVLGPGLAELVRTGSTNAVASALPKLADARSTYPHLGLVAGHLLNARFGGIGDQSKNLTILSASGNHYHQSFDNPVGQAVEKLAQLYDVWRESGIVVSQLTYGIRVKIAVSKDTWGTEGIDRYICDHLVCVAHLTGSLPKLDKLDFWRKRLASDLISDIKRDLNQANNSNRNGRIVHNTKR